jgi:hypothetical protein
MHSNKITASLTQFLRKHLHLHLHFLTAFKVLFLAPGDTYKDHHKQFRFQNLFVSSQSYQSMDIRVDIVFVIWYLLTNRAGRCIFSPIYRAIRCFYIGEIVIMNKA